MAIIENADGTNLLAVDTFSKSARVSIWPTGEAYSAAANSGLIAATTNGSLFTIRLNPNADDDYRLYLTSFTFQWSTITAFTTPATSRFLSLNRSTIHAAPSAQTAVTPIAKDATTRISMASAAGGGDIRISNTAAITTTGVTFDSANLAVFNLTGSGASGGTATFTWSALTNGGPIVLKPGQVLTCRTTAALDAAGTAVIGVYAEWIEGTF
jgi:hypothetical protein